MFPKRQSERTEAHKYDPKRACRENREQPNDSQDYFMDAQQEISRIMEVAAFPVRARPFAAHQPEMQSK
jgi:hypothetical protein